MTLAVKLHEAIEKYNILEVPTEKVSDFLNDHKTLKKIALIANHLFRIASMVAFMNLLPYSLPINGVICLAGSLFYRLTVETNCAYKFALPAFAGTLSYMVAKAGIASNPISAAPLIFTAAYIILTVSYDVDS